jgi:lysophospholipase L1-like esterase
VIAAARGLVALGDSITRGRGGSPVLGVHPQSWAQWLAEALELPYTNLAADGEVASGVLREQVPRLAGPYDLGCLYVGANDARATEWDPEAYEEAVTAIVAALDAACARVVLLTLPEDLGRPPSAPKPSQANAVLRAVAGRSGAALADLSGFGGRRHVLPDVVHPTALGQLAIADVAAAALGSSQRPSDLAEVLTAPAHRARFEAWWLRLWARDVVRRRRERRALTRQ